MAHKIRQLLAHDDHWPWIFKPFSDQKQWKDDLNDEVHTSR